MGKERKDKGKRERREEDRVRRHTERNRSVN